MSGMVVLHVVLPVHVSASGAGWPVRVMVYTSLQPEPVSVTVFAAVVKSAPALVVIANGTLAGSVLSA